MVKTLIVKKIMSDEKVKELVGEKLKKGFGFVLLIILLLLIAFIYNNNLAYLLAFLLASIFFVSILHSYKSISGIVVSPGTVEPVFAGEAAGFVIHLENTEKQHKISLHIKSGTAAEQQIGIAPHSTATVKLFIPTHKRGWQPLDTVTVFSYFPLGLFRAWSPIRFNVQALVYPKPALIDQAFPAIDASTAQNEGNKTGNDDFFGLLEYQALPLEEE